MIERDNYIDNIRGIATISVIFIHTVFWSGSSYIPNYMRNISLFFDVPIFFLLTGMSFYLTQKFDFIKQIFKLMIFFSIFIILCQICFFNFNINNILSALLLNSAIVEELPLINGSYWFVPMYCVSIILSVGIIKTFKNRGSIFIFVFIGYYFFKYMNIIYMEYRFFGIPIDGLMFYTSCILIGYYFSCYRGKSFWLGFLLASLFLYLFLVVENSDAFNLQNYKFPVGLPYVIASFISLSLIMYGNFLKNKSLLTYIGKNSIFFYMSQGIGGSLILKIAPYFNCDFWFFKMLVLFTLNFFLSILFGYLLVVIYSFNITNIKNKLGFI